MQGLLAYREASALDFAADALGVAPRWLATGQGPRLDPLRAPDVRAMAELYVRAPLHVRGAVRGLLEAVTDNPAAADERAATADTTPR
jgi:hypothetical protein